MKFSCAARVLACLFLSGCGLFSPKPVLPKHAAADGEVDRADEFVAALQHADIIYVPVEAIGLSSAEQSAWKILEAFRRSGNSFAIAWTGVACDQQPLLDELTVKRDHVEAYLAQVRWNYTGRMCEQCKAILRANAGIHQVALGRPRIVYEKLQSGEALDAEQSALVPRGFRPAPGGLEEFAEQLNPTGNLREREIANLYHAYLFAEQFAAEKIVTFMREQRDTKLLVFSRRRDLKSDNGLPYFVHQKLSVRQINFDFDHGSGDGRPRLLTLVRRRNCAESWF